MGIRELDMRRNLTDKEKASAELELIRERSRVKQLALQIEESKNKTAAHRSGLRSVIESEPSTTEDPQYVKMMRELHRLKQDLSRLKLNIVSAIDSKVKAEKELEASSSKIECSRLAAEELRKEINKVNEDHVLVELARIEAEKEIQEITARRQEEAEKFAKSIRAAKAKIKSLRREIDHAKVLEKKLKLTKSDLSVLQNEMEFFRAMERNYQNGSLEMTIGDNVDDPNRSSLETVEAELTVAKNELASLKEEGCQIMASMDQVRRGLIQIADKNKQLKKLEGKTESRIQNLNSKLVKTKSKLEYAAVAEERTKSIVLNLETALQQLQTEKEAAKEEEQEIFEETESVVAETEIMESQFIFMVRRLRDAAEELEMAKASEDLALKKLKNVIERVMDIRTRLIQSSNGLVTLSQSEYKYLSQQAAAAEMVAKKKVAAAQAWIEALAAGQKEITMKTDLVEKETRDLRAKEVNLINEMEKTLDAQNSVEENFCRWRPNDIKGKHGPRTRKSSGIVIRPKKPEVRRLSTSSTARHSRLSSSSSTLIKKRKKAFPNLIKFLGERRNEENK